MTTLSVQDTIIDAALAEALDVRHDTIHVRHLQKWIVEECVDIGDPDIGAAFEGTDGEELIALRLGEWSNVVELVGGGVWLIKKDRRGESKELPLSRPLR